MIYVVNKGYYSSVLFEIILNILEKETIFVPFTLMLLFDTSHD